MRSKNGFDLKFFKRFYGILGVIFPRFLSYTAFLFILLLLLNLLEQVVIYFVGLVPSRFYKVLGDKDLAGFKVQTAISLGIILSIAVVKSTKSFVKEVLALAWRNILTKRIHSRYFADINYYTLNVLNKDLDNPDQRTTQDVRTFCALFGTVISAVIIAPFTISYYSYSAYTRTGWIGPTASFVFFLIGTTVNKVLMSPIVSLVVKQEGKEGDFRFKHMQIRSNAESLAFHDGASTELSKCDSRLDQLLKVSRRLIKRQYLLNSAVNCFDYVGSILSYLALAVPIFSGVYDDLDPSELSAIISENAFVCIYLISTFSSLVDLSNQFAGLAGVTHRVAELLESLGTGDSHEKKSENLDNSSDGNQPLYNDQSPVHVPTVSLTVTSSEKRVECQLSKVSFTVPNGTDILVKNLNLCMQTGHSILITGSSSSGKTSIMRVIRGLWPPQEGFVSITLPSTEYSLFYLPQKTYFTNGTLREQITYPSPVNELERLKEDDDKLLEYIEVTKMGPILERAGGLDGEVDWNWYDVLSPGEMQRIAFIRLFFHKPQMAFLDEATSALSLDMEDILYKECRRLDITLVSVGHRETLKQYHESMLVLTGRGEWALEDLSKPGETVE